MLSYLSITALWLYVGKANLFAPLYVMFLCAFVAFHYGVVGQMRYLIVSISDICLLPFFNLVTCIKEASSLGCCHIDSVAVEALLFATPVACMCVWLARAVPRLLI